jgi:hypothetical protein
VQLTDGSGLPPVVYPIHLQIQHSARRPASTTVVLSHQPWHIGQPPAARGRFDFRQLFQPCLPPLGRLHVFTTQGMPAAWRHHTLHCTDCMKEAQFVCLHVQRKLAKHEAKRKRAIQASRGHEGQMSAGRRGRNSVKSVAMGPFCCYQKKPGSSMGRKPALTRFSRRQSKSSGMQICGQQWQKQEFVA